MTTPTYNAAYFIAKFEAIPEELWCTGVFTLGDKHCALGYCGQTNHVPFTDEALALIDILQPRTVDGINDGDWERYPQPTPKQRILAALRDAQEAGR